MASGGFGQVSSNLAAFGAKTIVRARIATEVFGGQLSSQSKRTAPWRDRTGNARRSIHSEVHQSIGSIILAHGIGVYYGKYLELSNGGKYRVIGPTVNSNRNDFLSNYRRLLA